MSSPATHSLAAASLAARSSNCNRRMWTSLRCSATNGRVQLLATDNQSLMIRLNRSKQHLSQHLSIATGQPFIESKNIIKYQQQLLSANWSKWPSPNPCRSLASWLMWLATGAWWTCLTWQLTFQSLERDNLDLIELDLDLEYGIQGCIEIEIEKESERWIHRYIEYRVCRWGDWAPCLIRGCSFMIFIGYHHIPSIQLQWCCSKDFQALVSLVRSPLFGHILQSRPTKQPDLLRVSFDCRRQRAYRAGRWLAILVAGGVSKKVKSHAKHLQCSDSLSTSWGRHDSTRHIQKSGISEMLVHDEWPFALSKPISEIMCWNWS